MCLPCLDRPWTVKHSCFGMYYVPEAHVPKMPQGTVFGAFYPTNALVVISQDFPWALAKEQEAKVIWLAIWMSRKFKKQELIWSDSVSVANVLFSTSIISWYQWGAFLSNFKLNIPLKVVQSPLFLLNFSQTCKKCRASCLLQFKVFWNYQVGLDCIETGHVNLVYSIV